MPSRKNRNQTDTDTDTIQEDAPMGTDTDAAFVGTDSDDSTDVQPTEAGPEVSADMTAFGTALATAVADAGANGTVPDEAMTAVATEYAKLDRKGKAAALKIVREAMDANMNAGEVFTAKAYWAITKRLPDAARAVDGDGRTPTDPTDAFILRVVTANLAYNALVTRVPSGVADDWSERVTTRVQELTPQLDSYLDWTEADSDSRGDEPEVASEIKAAVKGKLGKIKSGGNGGSRAPFTGTRRNVGSHIASAFADAEVGAVLSITEIVKHKSTEYGDDAPSAGAVAARVNSGSLPDGLEVTELEGGKKAIRKAA